MSQELLSVEDMLVAPAPSNAPWPAAPAKEKEVYAFTCPVHGTEMVAMTKNTMTAIGTDLEAYRRAAQNLDAKCKELAAENASLATRHNDLVSRHQNLRDKMHAERLAKVEATIVLPEDNKVRGIVKKFIKR